jgi:hypothetical protein
MLYEDRLSKPATGCYFPFAAPELVARIRELGFVTFSYDERLLVQLQNCDVECPLGFQLCSFLPTNYVTQFSLPAVFPLALARKGVEAALCKFKEIDVSPHLAVRDQQFVVYRAYLTSLGALTVTQHIVSGVSRSYLQKRAASRLSKSQREPKNQKVLFHAQLA